MRRLALRDILDKLVILAIGTHSVGAGLALLLFPSATLELVGWQYRGPQFWPSQAGLFLLILGLLYLAALWSPTYIWTIILSKGLAVPFLVVQALYLHADGPVLLLAAGDGLMAAALALALSWQRRSAAVRP